MLRQFRKGSLLDLVRTEAQGLTFKIRLSSIQTSAKGWSLTVSLMWLTLPMSPTSSSTLTKSIGQNHMKSQTIGISRLSRSKIAYLKIWHMNRHSMSCRIFPRKQQFVQTAAVRCNNFSPVSSVNTITGALCWILMHSQALSRFKEVPFREIWLTSKTISSKRTQLPIDIRTLLT